MHAHNISARAAQMQRCILGRDAKPSWKVTKSKAVAGPGDGTVLLGGAARVTINLLLNGLLSHILRSKLDSFTSADRV